MSAKARTLRSGVKAERSGIGANLALLGRSTNAEDAPKQTFPAADHGAADPFRGQAQITEITANRAARAYPDG